MISDKTLFADKLRLLSCVAKNDRKNGVQSEVCFDVIKNLLMKKLTHSATIGETSDNVLLAEFFSEYRAEIRYNLPLYSVQCLSTFPNEEELEWFGKRIHQFLLKENFYVVYDEKYQSFRINWD